MPHFVNLVDTDSDTDTQSESHRIATPSSSSYSSGNEATASSFLGVPGQDLTLTPTSELSPAQSNEQTPSVSSRSGDNVSNSNHKLPPLPKIPGHSHSVSVPPLLVPKSCYFGWAHDRPVVDERSALKQLFDSSEDPDEDTSFNDIHLDDFTIYRGRERTHYPNQLVSLDAILCSRETCEYFLNGVIRRGNASAYIQRVELETDGISIDGFERPDVHSSRKEVFLQTKICQGWKQRAVKTYYRLGNPSTEYRQLHDAFLWLIDLTKHSIDYIDYRFEKDNSQPTVQLQDFAKDFVNQLKIWHGSDETFSQWALLHPSDDYRIALNRHKKFIHNRIYHLEGSIRSFEKHPLWNELMMDPAINQMSPENTVVTPYVDYCNMTWSSFMSSKETAPGVQRQRQVQAVSGGFSTTHVLPFNPILQDRADAGAVMNQACNSRMGKQYAANQVKNKFAIIRYDTLYTFVYVQSVVSKRSCTELDVIFLYLAWETICKDGTYPWPNELFLSDVCCCETEKPDLRDVLSIVDVKFYQSGELPRGLFVRQKFNADTECIIKATPSDLACSCRQLKVQKKKLTGTGTQPEVCKPLPGLSLFCGLGNFDHGLEVGGRIDIVAAIDINEFPIRTYAQNRRAGAKGLIHGSVNPYLHQVLRGSEARLPRVGNVQFICAGSPCQGFSLANKNRQDTKGQRNCSLVASTLSYIDTYLPKYVAIENVPSIGISGDQMIACLVGLGYQIRKLKKVSSANHGSAQSRVRYYLLAAAPGVELPAEPVASHVDPSTFVGAAVLSQGLPPIHNDTLICISYPDHTPGAKQTPMFRGLMENIPCNPYGLGVDTSIQLGTQSKFVCNWFRNKRRNEEERTLKVRAACFTRLDPTKTIPTLTTGCQLADNWGGGRILHWKEHRTLSLQEARRAQGIPDNEVIIGDIPSQWAQVGNAVNREVATALGKVIGQAWMASSKVVPSMNVDIEPSTPIAPITPPTAFGPTSSSESPMTIRRFQRPITLPIIERSPRTPPRTVKPAIQSQLEASPLTTHLRETIQFQNGPSPIGPYAPQSIIRRAKRVIEDSEDDEDEDDPVVASSTRRVRARLYNQQTTFGTTIHSSEEETYITHSIKDKLVDKPVEVSTLKQSRTVIQSYGTRKMEVVVIDDD